MALAVVRTDAYYDKTLFDKFVVVVPQITRLDCARRRVVFRVKKQYNLFSFQIRQRKLLSILVETAEQGAVSPGSKCVAMLLLSYY